MGMLKALRKSTLRLYIKKDLLLQGSASQSMPVNLSTELWECQAVGRVRAQCLQRLGEGQDAIQQSSRQNYCIRLSW